MVSANVKFRDLGMADCKQIYSNSKSCFIDSSLQLHFTDNGSETQRRKFLSKVLL